MATHLQADYDRVSAQNKKLSKELAHRDERIRSMATKLMSQQVRYATYVTPPSQGALHDTHTRTHTHLQAEIQRLERLLQHTRRVLMKTATQQLGPQEAATSVGRAYVCSYSS